MNVFVDIISSYAESLGAKVKFCDKIITPLSGCGSYELESATINIADWLDKDDPLTWFVMLHEVGHHKDVIKHGDDYKQALITGYYIFGICSQTNMKTPRDIQNLILAAESKAYNMASLLTKKLDIPIRARDQRAWRSWGLSAYREAFVGKISWTKYY